MGARPFKRAVAVTGTYTDRHGDEKKRYVNVGTLFKSDDGHFSLKMESVPAGNGWNGFISFFDIEERDGQSRGASQGQSRGNGGGRSNSQGGGDHRENFDLDDEIPF